MGVWGPSYFLSRTPELQLLPLTLPSGASRASAEEATDHLATLFFFLFRMYPTDPGLSQKQQTTETGTLFNMQWRTKTGPHYLPNSMQIVFISSSVMLSEAKLPRGEHALCQRPTIKKNKKQIKRQTLPSPISYLHANTFRLAYISSLSGIQ